MSQENNNNNNPERAQQTKSQEINNNPQPNPKEKLKLNFFKNSKPVILYKGLCIVATLSLLITINITHQGNVTLSRAAFSIVNFVYVAILLSLVGTLIINGLSGATPVIKHNKKTMILLTMVGITILGIAGVDYVSTGFLGTSLINLASTMVDWFPIACIGGVFLTAVYIVLYSSSEKEKIAQRQALALRR